MIDEPNWYVLMKDFLSRNLPREALVIYCKVRRRGLYILGLVPLTFKACASIPVISYGKALHSESVKLGADIDVVAATSMLDMYGKCRDIVSARKLFDFMSQRNVVTWNAMIGGYASNGQMVSAYGLFEQMSVRTAVTWNEMIHGYVKSGDITNARRVFDCIDVDLMNIVTWTVMIDGYVRHRDMDQARKLFDKMPERNFFVWSSMVSGYCKSGEVKKAKAIFDLIPVRNLVVWNSLISGYTQNGFCEEALGAFDKMKTENLEPDEVTVTSLLSACAQLGDLDAGVRIHQIISSKNINLNDFVLTALIDMYAKCGDLTQARSIFEGMSSRNKACWNSMITGFASHGKSKEALEIFTRMENSNEKPDELTCLSVLSACVHGGLVDEGLKIFHKMKTDGLIGRSSINIKHYGCIVDLLGRAGRLEEAYAFTKGMPVEANDEVWGALLGACKVHLDTEMLTRAMEDVGSEESHSIIISNIYAASARWENAERIRIDMANKGMRKITGISSLTGSSNSYKNNSFTCDY